MSTSTFAKAPIPVLFCIPYMGTGGAERQLSLLLKTLDRNRIRPELALFHTGGGLYEDILQIQDLPIHILAPSDRWSKWHLPRMQWALCRLARRRGMRAVFSYLPLVNTMALVAGTAAGAGVLWSLRASNIPWRNYSLALAAVFRWEAWLSPFAGAVIANSQAGAEHHMAHGYSRRTMRVIRNGVDTSRFTPNREAGRTFRQQCGIPQDALVVGQAARFDPQKDWPTFLRMAANLAHQSDAGEAPDMVPLCFCCIGREQGGHRDAMRGLAQELGIGARTVFAGEVRDMPAAYNALDVHVLASAYGEGVPNAVAEALACEIPCVVTNTGDAAWLVNDSACVVPPKDASALAHAVSVLLRDPPHALAERGRRGRKRVQTELSLDRLADQVARAVESLA